MLSNLTYIRYFKFEYNIHHKAQGTRERKRENRLAPETAREPEARLIENQNPVNGMQRFTPKDQRKTSGRNAKMF